MKETETNPVRLEWKPRSRTAETADFNLGENRYKAQVYWLKDKAHWNILYYPERGIAHEAARGVAGSLRAAKQDAQRKVDAKISWDQAAV